MSTGQIAGVIAAINQGELKQAESVVDRLDDEAVRRYAQKIVPDHEAAEAELDRLTTKQLAIKYEPSSTKTDLKRLVQRANRTIADETSARLAPTSLDAQIQLHKKALKMVDHLLSQTKPAELRSYLENLLPTLLQHLDQAQLSRKRLPDMESER